MDMLYKVSEYTIVSESSISDLINKVNLKLKEGWYIHGELVVSTHYRYQVLVKYDDPFIKSKLLD